MKLAEDIGGTSPAQLGIVDQAVAPGPGVLEHTAHHHGAARTHVERAGGIDQFLFGCAGEGSRRVVTLMNLLSITGVGIGVGVDVKEYEVRVQAMHRAKLWQRHQSVATHGHGYDISRCDPVDRLLDIGQ